MNKASNASIGKRLLMLLLSVAMVITMMPLTSVASYADDEATPITSAEEFAAMDAAGSYVLANDITVTEPYATQFTGTFDGDGHTVTLAIESAAANTGLFKQLSGAHVSNVNTEGSVSSSANYVAAIAGEATGGAIIENCMNSASVTGTKGNAGGIVGRAYNGVTITNCYNDGAIEGSGNRVGGISGYNSGGEVTIDGCVNAGGITGTNNQIGGITGNVSGGTTTISNSYNAGTVTGTGQYSNMAGGIIGQTTKSGPTDNLVNCYNVGTVSFSESTNTNLGALVGNKSNSGTVTNCYFLEGSAAVAVGGATVEGAVSKTAEEMQAAEFVAALNGDGDAFAMDTNGINGGYPVLSWQGGGSVEPELPVPVTAVTIEGEAKTGETLTAVATGADGAEPTNVTYQWQYEDTYWDDFEYEDVTEYYDIEGATEDTLVIPTSMAGKKLRVIAKGDENSSATSELTAAVAKGDDALVEEAAKALTNPFAAEYKEAATVTLPATGGNGTTITWESSDSAVISNDGVITLPEAGISEVTMTATLTLGEQSATKEFKVSVISEAAQTDAAVVDQVLDKFKYGTLNPQFGTDTNIIDYMMRLAGNPEGVTITMTSCSEPDYIAENGDITYFFRAVDATKPGLSDIGWKYVQPEVTFTVSKGDVTKTLEKKANIYWDQDKLKADLKEKVLDKITEDTIKGENESLASVSKPLSLPQRPTSYVWVEWTSSDEDVLTITKPSGYSEDPWTATPKKGAEEKTVTLTAKLTSFNSTNIGTEDAAVETVTKDFTVTVPALGEEELAQMQKDLDDNLTIDQFKVFGSNTAIDPEGVTTDVQYPLAKNTGVPEYGKYTFTYESLTPDVLKDSGYRGDVYRPNIGGEPATATVKVTMKMRDSNLSVSKELSFKVLPLTQDEIDKEIQLMEAVKAHYYDGIKGENTDQNDITADLHNFQEVRYDENGELVWVYNYTDRKDTGIKPDDLDPEHLQEAYNLFRSSHPAIIQHENLRLVSTPQYDTEVTIDSILTSIEYGKYAELYPDNADLQKLYKQPVSATVTVKGTDGPQPGGGETTEPAEPADVTLTVSNQGTIAKAKDGSAMVEKEVTVTDLDKDGHLTYDEALVAAHEEYFDGGKACYATGTSQYGAYVTKMWGVSTSGFLFFIDGTGLSTGVKDDEVAEGDNLYAASLADETMGADWYAMFDKTDMAVRGDKEITVTLKGHLGMAYTPEDLADVPLEGIQIGIWKDGAFEAIDGAVTDAEGKATFTLPEGDYLLTATGTVKDEVYDWASQSTVEADCPIMAPYSMLGVSKVSKMEIKVQEALTELSETTDLSVFRAEEQVQVLSLMAKTQAAIAQANSSEEIDALMAKFREDVASVKTDAEYTAEEKEALIKAIETAKISGLKVKAGDKKATVSWTKNAKVTGYQISYQKSGAKAKTVKVTKATTVKKVISKLAAAKYTFKVRGYVEVDGQMHYTKWSAAKSVTIPSSAAVKSAKITGLKVTAGSKKATVSWTKNTKMDGYQISYQIKGSKAKTVKVTKNTTVKKTISKLTASKNCTFKVRGYKKIDGKTYYSKWSAAKTVKIKK